MNFENIKVIIFDLDGLLLDTEFIYNKCWCEAANYYGYNLTFNNALELRSLDSKLANDFLINLFGVGFNYKLIREKRNEYMKDYFSKYGINQKQGAQKLLQKCKDYNYKIAIASASSEPQIYEKLRKAGININFDYIVSTKNLKRGKPYPDVYLHTCKQLNIEPKYALVLEDSPNGIKAAFQAGCNVIMVPDLSPQTLELKKMCVMCCDNLNQVHDIFTNVNIIASKTKGYTK